jgi:hypothetical protein
MAVFAIEECFWSSSSKNESSKNTPRSQSHLLELQTKLFRLTVVNEVFQIVYVEYNSSYVYTVTYHLEPKNNSKLLPVFTILHLKNLILKMTSLSHLRKSIEKKIPVSEYSNYRHLSTFYLLVFFHIYHYYLNNVTNVYVGNLTAQNEVQSISSSQHTNIIDLTQVFTCMSVLVLALTTIELG